MAVHVATAAVDVCASQVPSPPPLVRRSSISAVSLSLMACPLPLHSYPCSATRIASHTWRSTCDPDQSLPADLGTLSWLGICFRQRIDESGKCRPHAAPSSTVARHSPRSIRPPLSADIILSTCCASAAASASFASSASFVTQAALMRACTAKVGARSACERTESTCERARLAGSVVRVLW